MRASGAAYQSLVASVFAGAPDVVRGVEACFEGAAAALVASDYADACPVATVALEVASSDEGLRVVAAEIFESWLSAARARLEESGIAAKRAEELAVALIAALEGGFLLSRVAKSPAPMQAIGRVMSNQVASELAR